jgi:hypothetical protein
MQVEEFIKLLEEQTGNGVHQVYIPSLDTKKKFKYLTVADLKTVSKTLLDSNGSSEYLTLSSLIVSLCIEELDLKKLTEYDRIAILLQIRANNFEEEEYTITCPECKTKVTIKLDISKMLDKLKKLSTTNFTYEDKNLKLEFTISDPSIQNLIEFKEYMEAFKKLKDENEEEDFDDDLFEVFASEFSQLIFVKAIKVNDQVLSDYEELDFMKKFKLINSFSTKVYQKLNSELEKYTSTYDYYDLVRTKITCINPECKVENDFFVDIDDFFVN